jgi:NitT/TauT family transport system permease protein
VSAPTRPTASHDRAAGPHPGAVERRRRLSIHASARLIQGGILVALILAWQVAAMTGLLNARFLPAPSSLVVTAGDLFTREEVWSTLGNTGLTMLLAFVIGTALGILVGFAFGLIPLLKDAFFPVVLFFMSTPKSIFIPLFLLIFGIGPAAPVAYAAYATFFYVCVNVVGGIGLVQERHLRVVRAVRGSWWRRIADVVLPASTPGVFAGVWYGISHAVLEVLIMELYISGAGIGSLIQRYTNEFQTGNVLVLVILIVIASVLLGTGWDRIERFFDRWRPERSGTGASLR